MKGLHSLRWITTGMTRGVVLVVIVAIVALFVDILAGPFVFLATKSTPVELQDGASVATIEGAIKGTDADSLTVRLPQGFLGLGSLAVVVVPSETKIAIGAKLGGFGDLAPGQIVRVAYEASSDRLVARRIEIIERGPAAGVEADAPRAEPPPAAPQQATIPAPVLTPTATNRSWGSASPAGPNGSAAAPARDVIPPAKPTPARPPAAAASALALKEARRLERMPVPRAATKAPTEENTRRVVEPAAMVAPPAPPPPATKLDRPATLVTAPPSTPASASPRVEPPINRGGEASDGSRQAP